jgi:hypothetical protein
MSAAAALLASVTWGVADFLGGLKSRTVHVLVAAMAVDHLVGTEDDAGESGAAEPVAFFSTPCRSSSLRCRSPSRVAPWRSA